MGYSGGGQNINLSPNSWSKGEVTHAIGDLVSCSLILYSVYNHCWLKTHLYCIQKVSGKVLVKKVIKKAALTNEIEPGSR